MCGWLGMRRSTRFRFPGHDQCCCVEIGDARQHHPRPPVYPLKQSHPSGGEKEVGHQEDTDQEVGSEQTNETNAQGPPLTAHGKPDPGNDPAKSIQDEEEHSDWCECRCDFTHMLRQTKRLDGFTRTKSIRQIISAFGMICEREDS